MTRSMWCVLLLATGVALADDAPKPKAPASAAEEPAKAKEDAKQKKEDQGLGMSILGNQEAPKALVIVPWKRSEMGDAHGIGTKLDDSRLPVDKDVFMRMLRYYEIRSDTTLHDGAPAAGRKTAPAETNATPPTAAPRRKS